MVLTIFFMWLMSMAYWSDYFQGAHLLPAINNNVFIQNEWWRVFTAIFIHSDIGHFLSNMLLLSVFSYLFSSYFKLKLLLFYSLLGAGLVNALAIYTYPAEVRLLGASGLVYLLGGLWLTLYFLIQRQYSLVSRSIRVLGVGIMLFFPSTFMPNTSYRTHAIGIGFFIVLI